MTIKPFFYGHDWIGEHLTADLDEMAAALRREADILEGKAALLREQMSLAASVDRSPKGGNGVAGAVEDESATRSEAKGDAHD